MKSAETCSCYLCNKYYISIHQIVVLDSRYTPILVYKDTRGMTKHMMAHLETRNNSVHFIQSPKRALQSKNSFYYKRWQRSGYELVWNFKLPLLAHRLATTRKQTLFLWVCVWVQRAMKHTDGADQNGVKFLEP